MLGKVHIEQYDEVLFSTNANETSSLLQILGCLLTFAVPDLCSYLFQHPMVDCCIQGICLFIVSL